jgi:hypothetical protein
VQARLHETTIFHALVPHNSNSCNTKGLQQIAGDIICSSY